MRTAVALRSDFEGSALRRLAKATKHAGQARRLLAMAEIYDGASRTQAARIAGVGLQTLRGQSWSWLAGQFGGLDKVDRDLHHAANLASLIRTGSDGFAGRAYASSGVSPPRAECGRAALS